MSWAQAGMAAMNMAGDFMGGGGAPPLAPPDHFQADNRFDTGPVNIGGINMGKSKGIDLSDPVTAVFVGSGVLIGGAILLKAVK